MAEQPVTSFTDRPNTTPEKRVSSLVSNSPDASTEAVNAEVEAEIKAELLKELSVAEVRQMIDVVKSGAFTNPRDAPDEFDEFGRNFRRMVHKMEVIGPSGGKYYVERPMANSLVEARKAKPPADFFDIDEQVWILRGVKRQRDYPENTVDGWAQMHGIPLEQVGFR
jgi:hypothetical protein